MTKISRDQLRRIIRETKASVDAETSKKSAISENACKEINSLIEAKKVVALHEARIKRQLKEYTDLSATIDTASEVVDVLSEKFFSKIGQGLSAIGKSIARSAIPGYTGYGGATSADIGEEIPEMQALTKGLKAVKAAEKAVKSKNLSDVSSFSAALMNYIKTFTNLYKDFKYIETDERARNALPDVLDRIAVALEDARAFLTKIASAVQLASDEFYTALKGSSILRASDLKMNADEITS
jgi:predicted nucleic acid-binding OB-fold protein